jgi:tyrosinase
MSPADELLRRDFGKGLAAIASAAFFGGCESILDSIKNRPVRRNVTSPAAAADVATYRAAVTAMKALPAGDSRNWAKQASIHLNSCPHGNWFFLPWHRVYLNFFEQICRELTGQSKFALPYWNWTLSPSIPAPFWPSTSELFNPRTATPASMTPAGTTSPAVLANILGLTDFQLFGSSQASAPRGGTGGGYGQLEGSPHNSVHGFVGGDMGGFNSPLDPVFWAHHNMIDLCWVDWNIYRNNQNANDPAWMNWEFTEFFDAKGNPAKATVGLSFLYPLFVYQYDADVAGAPKALMSKADGDRISELIRRGAPSKVEFEGRFPVAREVRVALGEVEPIEVRADAAQLAAFLGRAGKQRLLLTLDGVVGPATPDFFVRVFIGTRPPAVTDGIDSPNYAGSFAFFGDAHAGHGANHELKFAVDVSEAARRLQGAQALLRNGALPISLVPVPFADRTAQSREFTLKRLDLGMLR